MTLQIQSDHVYTQLGVPVSVTGVAQVTSHVLILVLGGFCVGLLFILTLCMWAFKVLKPCYLYHLPHMAKTKYPIGILFEVKS